MGDADAAAREAAANRAVWTRANREYGDDHANRAWAAEDITWGIFDIPEQQVGVLGDVRGLDVIELGCGTAYFSAWLARRGARATGVDVTPAPLDSARRCQERFGISFPLIEADAGHVPLPSGSFDLVISECGASLWCDPDRWIPEAAVRLAGRTSPRQRFGVAVAPGTESAGCGGHARCRARRSRRRGIYPRKGAGRVAREGPGTGEERGGRWGVCALPGSARVAVRDPGCLQLDHSAGCVVHFTDGQAEPVPEKPEPLAAGPGDQFFGVLRLLFGGVGVVHGSPVPFGRCRPRWRPVIRGRLPGWRRHPQLLPVVPACAWLGWEA